jgi:DNA polymerase delta subunit 2
MTIDATLPPAPSPSESHSDEWIAMISGLEIGPSSSADAQIQLLVEYLTGEGGGTDEQASASRISRLIIAGNSLAPQGSSHEGDKKTVS